MNGAINMGKSLIAIAALGLMTGAAFAQNSGPAPQSNNNQMNKPGNPTGASNSATSPGTTSGTTGMSSGTGAGGTNGAGMAKDSTNKDASRDKRGETSK
jgi:hypothetical protein